MKAGVSAIERAFELAKSGTVAGITDIRAALVAEGYETSSLEGRQLRRQLREAAAAVGGKNAPPQKVLGKLTFRQRMAIAEAIPPKG